MKPVGDACLARQAIYDVDLAVSGYELLYRSAPSAADSTGLGTEETAMSASTLTAALTDIGLDAIVGDRLAWVNVGAAFLVDDLAAVLPPERTVVEVLETTDATIPVTEMVTRLRTDGYCVALDDFEFRPDLEPLVKLANIVKVDVLAHSADELERQVDLLRPYGVELLAEKVETHEVLEHCRALGFTLFQGYFLSKPRLLSSSRVSTEAAALVHLAAQLNDPNASFDELAHLIATDVTLSYRMLRYVNSAYVGLRKPVGSLREALVELGLRRVRSWATLLLITDAADGRRELVVNALVRASMCERLAGPASQDSHQAFLVGLLSVVDALVDRPLDEVVAELPIDQRLADALLEHDGPLGDLLSRVIAYEEGDFPTAAAQPIGASTVTGAYLDAIEWSNELIGQMAGVADRRQAVAS